MKYTSPDDKFSTVGEFLKLKDPKAYEHFVSLSNSNKSEYIEANKDTILEALDFELLDNIDSLLFPLLNVVLRRDIKKAIEIGENLVYEFKPNLDQQLDNVLRYLILIMRYNRSFPDHTKEEMTRLLIPSYQMIYEGPYKSEVDFISLLLIKSDITYYQIKSGKIRKIRKNVTSLSHLSEEPVGDKLRFLKDQGFSLIADACDKDLRNAIAHMNLKIMNDGSIVYQLSNGTEKTISYEEFEIKHKTIYRTGHAIYDSLRRYTLEFADEIIGTFPKPTSNDLLQDLKKKKP